MPSFLSSIRGLSTEVPVGRVNGLDQDCVVSCDNIVTVPKAALGRQIGYFFPEQFFPEQEVSLAAAIRTAFDLE